MSNIKIICDTMNDLSKEIIDKYNIEVIPTLIIFNGKEYRAGIDIDGDEFYAMLRNSAIMPSTAQITYPIYLDIFKKYTNEGKDVLYLCGSSSASGTYQSAMLAKNDVCNKVHIIDTQSLSLGGGLLITEAAKMAAEGYDINYIENKIEEYKNNIHVFFSVSSLDYLQKGGRISSTKATIGAMLNVKPILKIENGLVKQKTQVRGNKKIIPGLIDELKIAIGKDFSNKDVYVGYGDDLKQRDLLIEQVKKEISPKNIYSIQIGSCVACHSGPTVLGLACLNK